MVKRKFPTPRRESNTRTPIVQPVAQRYTDWAIAAVLVLEYINKLRRGGGLGPTLKRFQKHDIIYTPKFNTCLLNEKYNVDVVSYTRGQMDRQIHAAC
jgi:hypothetical protein